MASFKAAQLAEEMSRFENEIMGASASAPKGPIPLFSPRSLQHPTKPNSQLLFLPPAVRQQMGAMGLPVQSPQMKPIPPAMNASPQGVSLPLPSAPMMLNTSQMAQIALASSVQGMPSSSSDGKKMTEAVAAGGGDSPTPVKQSGRRRKRDKKKLRMGGGAVWEDPTLDEWDSSDFRIFCGDLGNDVNDDTLARAFSKYPSYTKAKVIRDKHSKKTKGYGFVSFKDPHDFVQAMREMNGKYIGSRPVKLRKSTWKDRSYEVVKKKEKEKKKLGFK